MAGSLKRTRIYVVEDGESSQQEPVARISDSQAGARKDVGRRMCNIYSAKASASVDANWRWDCLFAKGSQRIRSLSISIHRYGVKAAASAVA